MGGYPLPPSDQNPFLTGRKGGLAPLRPQRRPLAAPRIDAEEGEAIPPPPPPRKAQGEPFKPESRVSLTNNLVTNAPRSAFNLVKSVVYDLPVGLLESAKWIAKDPKDYYRNLADTITNKYGTMGILWNGVSDYYTENFWDNLNDDPFRFVSDVAAVGSLGGGLAVKGGRLAATTGALSRPLARSLVKGGAAAIRAGKYVDPLIWTGKAASKIARPALEAVGYGKHTRDIMKIMSTYRVDKENRQGSKILANLSDGLDLGQKEAFIDASFIGDDISFAATKGTNAEISLAKWTKEAMEQEKSIINKGFITADDAIKSKAIGVEIRTKMKNKANPAYRAIGRDEAYDLIKAGKLNPTFLSLKTVGGQADDIFKLVNSGMYQRGFLARLERRLGGGNGYEWDPHILMARQIRSFEDSRYALNVLDSTKQYLSQRGDLKILNPKDVNYGELSNSLYSAGYAPFDDVLYKKYWDDYNRTVAAQVMAINKGVDPLTDLQALKDQIPEILKATNIPSNTEVWMPKHVAAMLKRELSPVQGMWALYDRYMSRFKQVTTLFNPKYWPSIVFGNALLATVYGLSPQEAKIAWKLRHIMPEAIKSLASSELLLKDKGLYSKLANTLGGYSQLVDNLFKAGVFTAEIRKHLIRSGVSFYDAEKQIAEAIKYYGSKPLELQNVRVAVNDLAEKVVEKIGGYKSALKDLAKEERSAFKGVGKREKKFETNISGLSRRLNEIDSIKGRADASLVRERAVLSKKWNDEIVSLEAEHSKLLKILELIGEKERASGGVKAVTAVQNEITRAGQEILELERHVNVAEQALYEAEEMAKRYGSNQATDVHGFVSGSDIDLAHKNIPPGYYTENERRFTGRPAYKAVDTLKKQVEDGKRQVDAIKQKRLDLISKRNEIYRAAPKQEEMLGAAIQRQTISEAGSAVDRKLDELSQLMEASKARHSKASEDIVARAGVIEDRARLAEGELRLYRETALNSVLNKEYEAKQRLSEVVAKLQEMGELQAKIPGLEASSRVADNAIGKANEFFASYYDMHPFERVIVRRLIPFYTFTKAMTMLAFKFPHMYPKRLFIGSHLIQAWKDAIDDDNSFAPPFLKNYVPFAANEDGSVLAIRLGSLNPMTGLREANIGGVPIPSIADIAQQHPVIRLWFELRSGVPSWRTSPASPGDYSVRMDNGEVVEWTGKGFKTKQATPNVIKSVLFMFPQAQLAETIFQNYAQSDRGWLFQPDPITGPGGKPQYPRGMIERLVGAIVPVARYNPQEAKMREMRRFASMVREYKQQLRFAGPVRRQQIMEALRAAGRIEYRRSIER